MARGHGGSGWHGERQRHSYARRKIQTARGEVERYDFPPEKYASLADVLDEIHRQEKIAKASGRKYPPFEELTLADHAELWWLEQGKEVPRRGTKAWNQMYEKWIGYAFADFGASGERIQPIYSTKELRAMVRDEEAGMGHYKQMARNIRSINPDYADVLVAMADDEKLHRDALSRMSLGKDVSYRRYVGWKGDNIIRELRKRGVVSGYQADFLEIQLKKQLKKIPKKELLRARGIEASLINGLLSGFLGGMGKRIGGNIASKKRKGR